MKSAFLHPVLFAIFPVLFLFSQNVKSLALNIIIMPLMIVIPFALLLFLIVTLIIRNKQKAGIMVSFFMLLFFSFGHFTSAIGDFNTHIFGFWLGKNRIVTLIWLFLILVILLSLRSYKKDLSKFTIFLNLFAVTLVAFQLLSSAYTFATRTHASKINNESEIKLKCPDILPDIYYIILDGYGRSDILKEVFDYDNSEFLNYLKETGFYIANESHSNYCQTLHSVISSLNLNYTDNIGVSVDPYDDDRIAFAERLWNNKVIDALADQLGYSSVSFASGYSLLELGRFDAYIAQGISLNEYHHTLIRTTPIYLLFEKLRHQYKAHRERIVFALDKIPNITEVNSPMFVYAHIIAPHPPFVFKDNEKLNIPERYYCLKDGSYFYEIGGTIDEYLEGYVNNLISINRMVKTTIDKLLATAKRPFIIILQGDHGPGSGFNFESLEDSNIRERYSILNAYYFYDQNYGSLYPQITPVNTFRVILNQYFGTSLNLLADRCYYSTWNQPFKFIEITDSLQKN